eukprot:scaffold2354_cov124-Isochrysis_galbana.AAC.7
MEIAGVEQPQLPAGVLEIMIRTVSGRGAARRRCVIRAGSASGTELKGGRGGQELGPVSAYGLESTARPAPRRLIYEAGVVGGFAPATGFGCQTWPPVSCVSDASAASSVPQKPGMELSRASSSIGSTS